MSANIPRQPNVGIIARNVVATVAASALALTLSGCDNTSAKPNDAPTAVATATTPNAPRTTMSDAGVPTCKERINEYNATHAKQITYADELPGFWWYTKTSVAGGPERDVIGIDGELLCTR